VDAADVRFEIASTARDFIETRHERRRNTATVHAQRAVATRCGESV